MGTKSSEFGPVLGESAVAGCCETSNQMIMDNCAQTKYVY